MATKNTDPKITLDKSRTSVDEIDEIDFPDVLSAERMSPNHYFVVFDGEAFNIRRPRRGARWKLTRQ
jgi:hypothetical protein